MLHILGNIGKGIGITIICLFILLIVLMIALLFIPIRYRLSAKKEDGTMLPQITVNASWFLHIISFQVCYKDELSKKLRVFGIPIRKRKSKAAFSHTGKSVKKATKPETPDSQKETSEEKAFEGRAQQWNPQPVLQAAAKDLEPEKKNLLKRIKDKIISFINFLKSLFDKLLQLPAKITKTFEKIRDKVSFYKDFWEREEMKRAVILCKKQLLHIWKNVHPRVIKGEIHFGFDDPSITGQVLGAYGAMYPFIGNKIRMLPEFETTVFEGNLLIKGYITIFVLLKVLWILYFNKDIRILMAAWKKEEV